MTRAWWRTTFRLWIIAAAVGAFLAMPIACVDTLADALVGNDAKPRVDTLFVPGPTDTLYCRHEHHQTECWR